MLRLLRIENGVPLVAMRLQVGSILPVHEGVDFVGPLVTIAMLPVCTLRAAALAHIQASDVVDFLNNELASHAPTPPGTQALNWTKLPGWLEQPAYPSTLAGDAGAIIAATRVEPLPQIMN